MGLLPGQVTTESLVSSMIAENGTWRWRLLVQAHGWIERGVAAPENFATAPSTSLGAQWDTLTAEMVGRALDSAGAPRPAWTRPRPLAGGWAPFPAGRRTSWDAELARLGILVNRNDLVSL